MSNYHDPNMPNEDLLVYLSEHFYVLIEDDGKIYRIRDNNSDWSLNMKDYYYTSSFLNKKKYHILLHHLIWYYRKGEWPKHQLDHKDRVRTNNEINNLRYSNLSLNKHNSKKKSGLLPGVGRCFKKYLAQIRVNRETIYLGLYETELKAHEVYKAKYKEVYGMEFEL